MAAFLRCLQDVVIIIPLQLYLRGHAVEALRTMLCPSQGHIGNRSCDTSIAIFEWMDGDKPEMRNRRLDDEVGKIRCLEPFDKGLHFGIEPFGGWRFVVNLVASLGARHHLHGPRA